MKSIVEGGCSFLSWFVFCLVGEGFFLCMCVYLLLFNTSIQHATYKILVCWVSPDSFNSKCE